MPVRSFPRLGALLACFLLAAPLAAQTPGATAEARPERPAQAFEAARVLFDGGHYGAAERAFADFLERHPRDVRAPEALFRQAESALATRDDRAAAALFDAFATRYPTSPLAPRARLALGRYYVASGDDALAEDALLAASGRGPAASRAEAHYLLGLVYSRQNRLAGAAAAFERAAVDDTPWAPRALYAVGALATDARDWAAAADALGRLRARYPGSPEDTASGLALADALFRTGRYADAADEAGRRRPTLTGDDADRAALVEGEARLLLGQRLPADTALAAVSPDSRYAQRAALGRGRIASAAGDWAAAATFLAIASAGSGSSDDAVAHEARYYRALALRELGQLGDAEAAFQATAQRRPDGAYAEAALLELGVLRYERRLYAEAAQALSALLEQSPRGPYAGEAARMLGEAYAASGDTRRAREAFQRAESLGTATAETRAEVAFQDAYAEFREGRFDRAVPALVAVADGGGPRAGEALFWAGEAAFQARDFARAQALLERLLREHPDHARADAARYVIAWTLYQRGQTRAAADAFERFLSAYSRSGELVPYYADALLRLGDLYTVLGRYAEARQVYGRVAAATPERSGGDYALFQTAQAFGREGRTDDALAAYARLLTEYPRSERYAQALLARGDLYSARGDDSLAIAAYERVLNERPDQGAAALVGIGDVLLNTARPQLAEQAYRRVFERYSASALTDDAFSGLADALDAQGRAGEIDRVFSEIDRSIAGLDGRARLRYARARYALSAGQDSVAVVYLEEALAGPLPADLESEALLALSGAYTSTGRAPDAVRALRRLLARDGSGPLAGEAQLRLAEALLASGDAAGALDAARRLASADAGRAADGLALEALALQDLGRADEADAALRRLIQTYPDSPAAQAALRDRPDLAPASGDTPRGSSDGQPR